jgi:hypothetical protein
VTVACSDCYIDFTLDVFFDISIRDFRMQNLSAGFRDIAVNGSVTRLNALVVRALPSSCRLARFL